MWLLWFRRYGYLSKTAKFSFLTMDYSPWLWRSLIDRNQLKKLMQVRVDIGCMRTDFSRRGLWFRRYGYLSKTAKFSFLTMDYSPWSWRKLIDRNRLKKFMQVRVDIECMHTFGFGGCGCLWFRRYGYLQKRPNFPS